jgi:hypothetical protein
VADDFIKPRVIGALAFALFVGFFGTNLNASSLPTQDQVFTIYASKAPVGGKHASSDLIYSALPLYQEFELGENRRWSKDGIEEQGVIVLKDKSVLYFETQSSRELVTIDSSNHSVVYRMPDLPTHLQECPTYNSTYDQMSLPKPAEAFCAATPPWVTGQAFTSDFLIDSLPHLKPTSVYPSDWVEASKHNTGAGGVLVSMNRAVLEYFAWSPSAVTFENYKSQTYFMMK